MPITNSNDLSEYLTIQGFVDKYGGLFTLTQLRWALRDRERNGLGSAVVRFGRRLYLHEPSFRRWFDEQRASSQAA